MKKIDIEITPNITGSTLKIDETEVQGVSKISLHITAQAGNLTPDIELEFEGFRKDNEGNIQFISVGEKGERIQKIPEQFSHKIKPVSVNVSIAGTFNEYPFE